VGVSKAHHDRRWRGLRLQALRRDGWRCVRCGSRHRLEVDHIERVEDAPALAWELSNLQVLCRQHHLEKTAAERGQKMDPARRAWRDAVLSICQGPKSGVR